VQVKDDKLFIMCYSLFKKRGFDPKHSHNETDSFLTEFCKSGRVTKEKLKAIFTPTTVPASNKNPILASYHMPDFTGEEAARINALIMQNTITSQKEKEESIADFKYHQYVSKRKPFLALILKLK
jgi:hypothetical protein